jgi:putative aldouronate transport system substrate-binding protein
LTDSVEKYGAALNDYLGEVGLIGPGTIGNFDGRQFLITAKRVAVPTYNTFIRQDWLEALNLPIPANRDQFFDTMVAFRDQIPALFPDLPRVIPYTMATNIPWNVGNIIDSFIDQTMDAETRFVYDTGYTGSASSLLYPGFKEGMRYVNRMWNENLIDPEFSIYSDFATPENLIMQGIVGAYTSNYEHPLRPTPGVLNQLRENHPGALLVPIGDSFPNAQGVPFKQIYNPWGIFNMVPIFRAEKADAAIQYLNLLAMDEHRLFLTVGEEGVHHTMGADGIPSMHVLENDRRMFTSPNNLDLAMIVNGIDFRDDSKNARTLAKSFDAEWEHIFEQCFVMGMNHGGLLNPIAAPPTEAEGRHGSNLQDLRQALLVGVVTASAANFDSVFDAAIAEFLASGGQEVVDQRQAYWNEFLAG